jgi:magnesium transporter
MTFRRAGAVAFPSPQRTPSLSLQTVAELMSKQKRIEGMVRNQPMHKHDLVETVVHKQHRAELRKHLERLSTSELGTILQTLPEDDAHRLWAQMDEEQDYDVLWEVSDDLRERLARVRTPSRGRGQLSAFALVNGRLSWVVIHCRAELERIRPIWIDLRDATRAERTLVGQHFGLSLPNPEDLTDLESSARFYVEDDGKVHLHADFLRSRDSHTASAQVALVLHREILFSVRSGELPIFRLQRLRARTQPGYVSNCKDLLLDLYGAGAEYCADALEDIYDQLDDVGRNVLSQDVSDMEAARILSVIARAEALNGRIRRNILDTQRAMSFLLRGKLLSQRQLEDVQQILRDMESLSSHTAFLFDKINFLMDATVGFININQNKVIKMFSVASVAMLPPTLIASIYGMNFKVMPELGWPFGYPFAFGLMVISVLAPFWLFQRKGWLK